VRSRDAKTEYAGAMRVGGKVPREVPASTRYTCSTHPPTEGEKRAHEAGRVEKGAFTGVEDWVRD
jgi:hypothetical protein